MAPEPIFDRGLLDRRRRRAVRSPSLADALFLLDNVSRELADRLSLVERRFERTVDLASHSGLLAGYLASAGRTGGIVRLERDAALLGSGPGVVADEEFLPFRDASLDLIVSALSLHLTNDTPGVLIQARRALKPDGLFLAAMLGGDTLTELRTSLLEAEAALSGGASPRVIPMTDVRDAGGLLQRAGFALPVADQDRLTVRYASMFELMRDLRAMGMANMLTARRRTPSTQSLFARAAEIYARRFADPDGRVRATFDVIYMSGWAPHESQQKPLRPGSAKVSLAAVLKDRSGG